MGCFLLGPPTSSSFAAPDILSHGFESGAWSPLEQSSGTETITTNEHHSGSRAAQGVFTSSPGADENQGVVSAFSPTVHASVSEIYARWYTKFSATFQHLDTGTKKEFRCRDEGQSALMGTLDIIAGEWDWSWDGDPNQTRSWKATGPARDVWVCVEVYNKITHGAQRAIVWIDGTQVIDSGVVTDGPDYGSTLIGAVVFGGTFNDPVGNGTQWWDDIALSTQRIGT